MALSINELKTGLSVFVEGQVFVIVGLEHVKPGKGAAFVRVKIKNLKNNNVLERTFRSVEKIEEAFIDLRKLQYTYKSGQAYHFMDTENFEEVSFDEIDLGEAKDFLKDNLELTAAFYDGKILNVNLPNFVEYKIIHTETGRKGDTVKAGTKPAEIESGRTIAVPLFVNEGDTIKVDTRTGEYIERVG